MAEEERVAVLEGEDAKDFLEYISRDATKEEKDSVDIISLILDRVQEISVNGVVKKCEQADLIDHLLSQVQDFAKAVRQGEIGRTWSQVTGTTLTGVQVRSIQKFLRELDKALRE